MPDDSSVPKTESHAVLKALGEASALFLALTFVGGWSYLASYFKMFGLNALEFEFSVPVVSTIAVHMLYDSAWSWPLIVACLLLALLAWVFRHFQGVRTGWIVAAVMAFLFLSASAGVIRGRQIARQDTLEVSNDLPNVTFFTAKLPSKFQSPIPKCVAFEATYDVQGLEFCRLLLHSRGVYYFFKPIKSETTQGAANIDVYAIVDSDIEAVHIQRGRN